MAGQREEHVVEGGAAQSDVQQADPGRIELIVRHAERVGDAQAVLARVAAGQVVVGGQGTSLTTPVQGGPEALMQVLRELDAAGVELLDVGLRRPTLDDVFLALTGQPADDTAGRGAGADRGPGAGRGPGPGPDPGAGTGRAAEEVGP